MKLYRYMKINKIIRLAKKIDPIISDPIIQKYFKELKEKICLHFINAIMDKL